MGELARVYGHVRDWPQHVLEDKARPVGNLLACAPAPFPSLFAVGDTIPDHFDLLKYCAPVRLQYGGCCVGEWLCRAVHTRSAILHDIDSSVPAIAYPSPVAAYSLGRMIDANGQPLTDGGSRPRAVVDCARDFGVVSLTRWDPGIAGINREVPQDVLLAGADAHVTSSYRVDAGDIQGLLAAALLRGFMPGYGQPVDDAYENLAAGAIFDGLKGPSLGNHMQAICGYDFRGPVPFFMIIGSWGAGFADAGIARVSAAFLASNQCFDRTVITSAPLRIS